MPTLTVSDEATIAYTRAGAGPAVVLVGGALDDGTENAALIPALSEHLTVYNYTRRGRGNSTGGDNQSLQREIEDLAAVIDAADGSAHLFGASSGGALALEAVAAGVKASRVAVYEVPYAVTPEAVESWQEYARNVLVALENDDRDRALEFFMEVAGLPAEMIAESKKSPQWAAVLPLVHTLAYDVACLNDGAPPTDRLAKITQPVLAAARAEQGPFFEDAARAIADAVDGARMTTVASESHAVDASLAPMLIDFYQQV